MGERRRDGELEDGMGSKGCLRLPGLGEVRWPLDGHPKTVILPLVTIEWRYNQYCMVLHCNHFSFLCVLGPVLLASLTFQRYIVVSFKYLPPLLLFFSSVAHGYILYMWGLRGLDALVPFVLLPEP